MRQSCRMVVVTCAMHEGQAVTAGVFKVLQGHL